MAMNVARIGANTVIATSTRYATRRPPRALVEPTLVTQQQYPSVASPERVERRSLRSGHRPWMTGRNLQSIAVQERPHESTAFGLTGERLANERRPKEAILCV